MVATPLHPTPGGVVIVMIHTDEWGHELGYCNSCGEECEIGDDCCEDGEIVEYDDEESA